MNASRPVCILEDHPRSRGVYNREPAAFADFRGSSPLARGLPSGIEELAKAGGIIPARAGFTDDQ